MMWWLGRPSHRTTINDSDTAARNVVVVNKALKPTTITDSDTAVRNGVVVMMALTPHYNN